MALPGVVPREESEMEKVRRAFVERAAQPTYEELTQEFGVPRSTLGNWASKEGWVAMRAGFFEQKAKETNALAVLVEAAQNVNRPIVLALTDAVLSSLHGISQTLADIDPKRAASSRMEIYNTATFAIKNLADACKSIGVVGMPKGLQRLSENGAGDWTPQMMHQINVNIGQSIAPIRAEVMPEPVKSANVAPDTLPTS